MMKINSAGINVYLQGWFDDMPEQLKEILSENKMGWMERFKSPCGRYVLMTTNITNMCDGNGIGWNLHINNSNMKQIGSVNVEFIEQVKQIIEIYKDY